MAEIPLSPNEAVKGMRGGPAPDRLSIENLSSPKIIADILHKTADLSDEEFNDIVDKLGSRAAHLVLRHKAINGDVKALDLYLRRCDERRKPKRAKQLPGLTDSGTSGFMAKPRLDAPLDVVDDG